MRSTTIVALVVLASSARAQEVFVVDESFPPGTFTSVDHALSAGAGDGDVILVRPGTYEGFSIDGQGVTIVADEGGRPLFVAETSISIAGLAPGELVVLRGFDFLDAQTSFDAEPPFDVWNPLIDVVETSGLVWIEDCDLEGGGPALRVGRFTRAVVERCDVEGRPGVFDGFASLLPGAGIEVAGDLTLHRTTVVGGSGKDGSFGFPSIFPDRGGNGATVYPGGVLTAFDSAITGGMGGDGFADPNGCNAAATGGTGLHMMSLVRAFGTSLAGGPPGLPGVDCPPAAGFGLAVLNVASPLQVFAHSPIGFEVAGAAREGEELTATLTGQPGALAFLVVGFEPESHFLPSLSSTLLVDSGQLIVAGAIPPSGVLSLGATVDELGPGVSAAGLVFQAGACSAGSCTLGEGSIAVLLDAAF